MQANDAYWAYVLVQYDELSSSYTYGFTFKDSAGYGMYPMSEAKIDSKGSQIQTGLNLTRPKNGKATNFIESSKWDGFSVDGNTELVVLESTSEDGTGDGKNTCTLRQKGNNYAEVEDSKVDPYDKIIQEDKNKPNSELPILMPSSSTTAFWRYREKIKTITFQDSINIPNNISDEHKWDVSASGNGMVMAYITPNATDSTYYDLYIQGDKRIYANPDSSYLFWNFRKLSSINNLSIFNTTKVTNMQSMFCYTGQNTTIFKLDLGNEFYTGNVTNMKNMFYFAGGNSKTVEIKGLENFNTSSVTDMSAMFSGTGSSATNWDIGDISSWDTSKVTNMNGMFDNAGVNATIFNIGNLGSWNTSNVTDMSGMFGVAGNIATTWYIGDLSKWNTSKVTNMSAMFSLAGGKTTTFNIGNLGTWDTSNVTDMSYMFNNTGKKSSWTLDCSKWKVEKVINNSDFNSGVANKIIAPNWVN